MDRANMKNDYLALVLLESLEDENLRNFEKLIKEFKADPNHIVTERGISAFHYACGMENLEMSEKAVKFILENGGDPNIKSTENMTPLHVAAISGRSKITKMLLDSGADFLIVDSENYSPFQYAIYECHFDVIEAMQNYVFEQKIEKNKMKILNEYSDGATSNHLAVNNNMKLLQRLEEKKFTPNRINYNFDVTSPYYINITHRRKKPSEPCHFLLASNPIGVEEEIEQNEANEANEKTFQSMLTSTMINNSKHAEEFKNIFELTEQNVTELSKNIATEERSRVSLIKNWRDRVQKSKNRKSILDKFYIDELLNDIMTDENFDFTNSMMKSNNDKQVKMNNDLELGQIVQRISRRRENQSDGSFKTALEVPSMNESNFIHSPKSDEYVFQMAEQYEHIDHEHGLIFFEEKYLINPPTSEKTQKQNLNQSHTTLSTEFTVPLDYDTEALRHELTQFGEPPGPITKSTKRLYTKRLLKYRKNPEILESMQAMKNDRILKASFSIELERTVRSIDWYNRIPEYLDLENQICEHFKNSKEQNKKLREGNLKQSFIYFLVDPRISENLPCKSKFIGKHEIWKTFLSSIFYVGKGKSSRPYSHLYDAFKIYLRKTPIRENTDSLVLNGVKKKTTAAKCFSPKSFLSPHKKLNESKKLERILDIWSDEYGVVCLHVFHNLMPAEAYTREAAIIDAIGLQHLTNLKRGDYYGPAQSWTMRNRKCLGIALLLKALKIHLAEGESQLLPSDLF